LIGEAHEPETHLVPLAIAAGLATGKSLTLFGDDFDTPDGTCLRDYVHVSDLAAAHVAALEADLAAGAFEPVNVGSGVGRSVREVIETVGRSLGARVRFAVGPRRPGDPASLVADPARALAFLGWKAANSSLEQIVADAIRWELRPAYGRHASLGAQ
jgi:UDP-glucose 4-epimerase